MRCSACTVLLLLLVALPVAAEEAAGVSNADYVRAVTRGAGAMPGQQPYPSEREAAFRARMEARKDALLAERAPVAHPVLYTDAERDRARANVASSAWAREWRDSQIALADYLVAQPDGWIAQMIPFAAPAHGYGFTCPHCVGEQSQEAVGYSLARWSYKTPEALQCTACGQTYPDAAYPETATLELPRTGHTVTYYLNDAERAHPDDRSGRHAWHWVGYPIHVSFSGLIRERKIRFMTGAAESLALAYLFTGDARYAAATRDVLTRFARAFRVWPYRDYWDSYADCDPLYAAWHHDALPLTWKRHLSERAFEDDTVSRARMLRNYWGAGRLHVSTGGISSLPALAAAYDLTCMARHADGTPVWPQADRTRVERDLLLEFIFEGEPFVGGAGRATNASNKAPRIYNAMAVVAKTLGLAPLADIALRGYERVRDESFNPDGFCTESPSYNNMYLSQLLRVPEALHGFTWPEDFDARQGRVDYYRSDPLLRRMYRGILWTLLPSGEYIPLSDTRLNRQPADHLVHFGLRRYPDLFAGTAPRLGASRMSRYALFQLDEARLQEDAPLVLPETLFPDWGTALLRHGTGTAAHTLSLSFSPWGGHRQYDNLSIFYDAGGQALLSDLGYVGDMPVNDWIKATHSHNLVVVDDARQLREERRPQFELMAGSPLATVVEASSRAYPQCSEYRRRVTLLKVAPGVSFAVDLFRVRGGARHAYRVVSELASSDAAEGVLQVQHVDLAPEPPLPEVGASLARDAIYGRRDVRTATPWQTPWHATWHEPGGAYRLWMCTPVDHVEAANAPGQRSLDEAGRRVRMVDAVREGAALSSVFVAVHEPRLPHYVYRRRRAARRGGGRPACCRAAHRPRGRYVLCVARFRAGGTDRRHPLCRRGCRAADARRPGAPLDGGRGGTIGGAGGAAGGCAAAGVRGGARRPGGEHTDCERRTALARG